MMRDCRIVAKNPPIDITIPMGDGAALPTGGLGGWTLLERQDDVNATIWEGQEPLTEDVPLLLDGYPDESVQREWNTVKKLGRDANGERKPPVFRVHGPLDHDGKAWVLPAGGIEINADRVIKRDDGDLLRIEFVLHLLEYVAPDEVRLRGKHKTRQGLDRAEALTYVVRKGDTLQKIATRLLGNPARWKEIGQRNDIHDPLRVLPVGRVLQV